MDTVFKKSRAWEELATFILRECFTVISIFGDVINYENFTIAYILKIFNFYILQ